MNAEAPHIGLPSHYLTSFSHGFTAHHLCSSENYRDHLHAYFIFLHHPWHHHRVLPSIWVVVIVVVVVVLSVLVLLAPRHQEECLTVHCALHIAHCNLISWKEFCIFVLIDVPSRLCPSWNCLRTFERLLPLSPWGLRERHCANYLLLSSTEICFSENHSPIDLKD